MQTLEKSTTGNQNYRIPTELQVLLLISTLLLAIVGLSLFFNLNPIRSHWIWPLTPFNTKFLGAVYFSAFIPTAIALWHRRWSSSRILLPMLATFTTIATLVSVLHLEYFAMPRRAIGIWWFLYLADSIGANYCLWRYWSRIKRTYTLVQLPVWNYIRAKGWLLLAYGTGLLLLPTLFTGFWPWKIDAFHGQMYSALFLAGGLGLLWLGRTAIEWLILGITQFSFGSLAILGTLLVNSQVHKINGSLPSVWLWFAIFVELTVAGLFMIWQALHIPVHSSQH